MRTATLALLLAGCGMQLPPNAYPPQAADRELMAAVDDAWRARGLEDIDTERCEEERRRIRLIVAGDEQFPGLCGYCNPGNCPDYRASEGCPWGCAQSCTRTPCVGSWPACWGTGNEFLGGQEHRLIVVHRSFAEGGATVPPAHVRHEYIHALEECSGRGVDHAHGTTCQLPDGDPCRRGQTDCACRRLGPVWGPGGVNQSLR